MQSPQTIRTRRGLDVEIAGRPRQALAEFGPVRTVAISGHDFPGLRPDFMVASGDRVRAGQALFVDRRRPRIAFAAPVAGVVEAINRGHRRSLDTLVISAEGGERQRHDIPDLADADAVRDLLLASGLWPSFLTRPFGRIPDPDASPDAIFVTAIDTSPLAADPRFAIGIDAAAFRRGLAVLPLLTAGPVVVCAAPGEPVAAGAGDRIVEVSFAGPHPAGLPGTHIHALAPVAGGRTVWQIGCQDVIAIGHLVETGHVPTQRIISVAGPMVVDPALARVPMGASLDELLQGRIAGDAARAISGSVLSGREAGYLGRHHGQVTVIAGDRQPEPAGLAARLGALLAGSRDAAIIPREAFERAFPFDIPPVPLLRALSIGDAETARDLGCLELVEEDLALISHLCTSGTDYGALLRRVLDELGDDA